MRVEPPLNEWSQQLHVTIGLVVYSLLVIVHYSRFFGSCRHLSQPVLQGAPQADLVSLLHRSHRSIGPSLSTPAPHT